jgi:hypothetical protein
MCRNNPNYAKMEAAHNGGTGTTGGKPNAVDMTLQDALASIEGSKLEGEAE